MFYIFAEDMISSSHQLRGYEGKCEKLHGHNWQVKVCVKTEELNKIGLGIDFKVLKKYLKNLVDDLDHININEEVEYFKTHNPSAENIAYYLYYELEKILNENHETVLMDSVQVWETPKSSVIYKKD